MCSLLFENYVFEFCEFNIVVFVAVGDTVEEDEVVCEIETDKVLPHSCLVMCYIYQSK